MTILVDISTPAFVTSTGTTAITTASFVPPTGSLIVASGIVGAGTSNAGTFSDNLGGGWVADWSASLSGAGYVAIGRRTSVTLGGLAMTITWTPSGTGTKGLQLSPVVLTGCLVPPQGGTVTPINGTGTTAGISFTPSTLGSFVIVAFCDTSAAYTLTGPDATTVSNGTTSDATNSQTYGAGYSAAPTTSLSPTTFGWTNGGKTQVDMVVSEYLAGSVINPCDTMYRHVLLGGGMSRSEVAN